MAKKAKSGAGCQLQMGNAASPEVFTKLGQLLTLKKAGKKINLEKVTNQDSDVDANGLIYEEFMATIVSGGSVDYTLNFDPKDTTQRALLAAFDGQQHNFKIVGPNDSLASPVAPLFTWAFKAYVSDYPDADLPLDKAMTLSGKLTITGSDTLTYSS